MFFTLPHCTGIFTGIFHCKLAGPWENGPSRSVCCESAHRGRRNRSHKALELRIPRLHTRSCTAPRIRLEVHPARSPGAPAIVSQDIGTSPGSQAFCQGHERHKSTTAEVPALEGSDHQPAATPASSPRRSVAAAPFLREITRSQTPNLHSVISYHVYKMASHRWCPMLPRDSGRVHAMSQAGQKARCLS